MAKDRGIWVQLKKQRKVWVAKNSRSGQQWKVAKIAGSEKNRQRNSAKEKGSEKQRNSAKKTGSEKQRNSAKKTGSEKQRNSAKKRAAKFSEKKRAAKGSGIQRKKTGSGILKNSNAHNDYLCCPSPPTNAQMPAGLSCSLDSRQECGDHANRLHSTFCILR